jgi:RimJ/RimL family protein N-acetyltransferase
MEASRLVLDHAFAVPSMRNVMLNVYEFNIAGVRAYEKQDSGSLGAAARRPG